MQRLLVSVRGKNDAIAAVKGGADIVKVGLAELKETEAKKVMTDVVKQVRFFFKKRRKKMITTFFADKKLRRILGPVTKGPKVSASAKAEHVNDFETPLI